MALHPIAIRIAATAMLLLSLAGGVLVLGGVAEATDECRTGLSDAFAVLGGANPNSVTTSFPKIQALVVAGTGHMQTVAYLNQEEDTYDCGIFFSYEWWLIAFEIFTVFYGILATWFELFHSKYTVMALFAVKMFHATLVTSIYTKIAYMFNGGGHSDKDLGQAASTGTAGGIMLHIGSFLFMFLFGTADEGLSDTPEVTVEK